MTILIPRHPNRADEIKTLFGNIKFAQRSKNQNLEPTTEIYLVDSLGELGTFYKLTNFTFLGGSLLPIGGHNPFEPIKLGCAVITGSHVFNFKEIYENLAAKNACVFVNTTEELSAKVGEFLLNATVAESLIHKGLETISSSHNIAKKITQKTCLLAKNPT